MMPINWSGQQPTIFSLALVFVACLAVLILSDEL